MVSQFKKALSNAFKSLFLTPISTYRHWGIIIVVALAFVFIPEMISPNDWERNTAGLFNGLEVYSDQSAVYPPWGLILLWPYYLLTAPGTRVASVLVIGWLASKESWTLMRFIAVIISPHFMWTMMLSNVDVLAFLLPILLWESADGRQLKNVWRSISWLLLLLKPQGGIVMFLFLGWKNRYSFKSLLIPFAVVLLVVVPISLLGNPPLIFQWITNTIINPSKINLEFWHINNVSLTDHIGWVPGGLSVIAALGVVCTLMRVTGRKWSEQHTYASVFLISMLLSPYASNQSVIVPLALVGSWTAVVIQYFVLGVSSYLRIFLEHSAWWTLLLGICALWLYKPQRRIYIRSHRRNSVSDPRIQNPTIHKDRA